MLRPLEHTGYTGMPGLPEVIVYGGGFDPPHCGHFESASQALAAFPAARLFVMPSPTPAGAAGLHKSPAAPFATRMAMAQVAFAGLGPRVVVTSLESQLPAPHFTLATLRAGRGHWGSNRLALLIGQDQLASFHEWHEPRSLLHEASLIVVPRPPADGPPLREIAAAMADKLGWTYQWDAQHQILRLAETTNAVYLLPHPVTPAASRTIRRCLQTGAHVPPGWLAPAIHSMIHTQHLYGAKTI